MFYQISRCPPGGKRLAFVLLLHAMAFLPPGTAWAQASAASVSSALPFKQDGGGIGFPASGGILLFFLILTVLLCLVYAGRRRQGSDVNKSRWLAWLQAPAGSAELKVTASTRLAGRTSLHVIEWEGGKLLVACGEQGVVRLAAMPPLGEAGSWAKGQAAGDLS